MQEKLGLWYSRFEPKPAKGFGAAIMGEQEFRKGPGKTHTLWTARERAVAVESCRGITQNNIPNLAHIGARFPAFLSRAFQPQTLSDTHH